MERSELLKKNRTRPIIDCLLSCCLDHSLPAVLMWLQLYLLHTVAKGNLLPLKVNISGCGKFNPLFVLLKKLELVFSEYFLENDLIYYLQTK